MNQIAEMVILLIANALVEFVSAKSVGKKIDEMEKKLAIVVKRQYDLYIAKGLRS